MGHRPHAKIRAGFTVCSLLGVACGDSESDHPNPNASGGSGGSDVAGGSGASGQEGGDPSNGGQAPDGNGGAAGSGAELTRERIGDYVFDEDQVHAYYLTFSDEEYARLMDFSTLLVDQYTVNTDRYVEATLRFGDTELPSIGVRIKGNYSIWGCVDFATGERVERVEPFFGDIDVCQRFSLKLDFDRYDESLRLDGLKKLNLHAMAADPSKLRERLGYSLFREMDIVAPRSVHARVYINGEYHGLYAAVEQVDGRFTANRFPSNGDGNLYTQLWPTEDITVAAAEDALKTNDDSDTADVSDFLAFKDAIATSTEADFATTMAPYLDFDYLARYIVVDRAITNYDGIMAFYYGSGWGPYNQNYYWYNLGGGRFMLIPWDFDKAFWYPEPNFWTENAANGQNIVPNWNVVTSDCGGYACSFDAVLVYNGANIEVPYRLREIDCDPFLRLLRGEVYDRQAAIASAFIAGPFSEASVSAKVEAWRTQIAEAIEDDPLVDSAHWQSSVDDLLADLPRFQRNLSLMMSGLITE
jgi:spore coat protein CotH